MNATTPRSGVALAGGAFLAALGGGAIGGLLANPGAAPAAVAAREAPAQAASFAEVAAQAMPAVVHVSAFDLEPGLPPVVSDPTTGEGDPRPQQPEGSGFVIDAQGLIVTSRHVVRGPGPALVRFADRRELVARFVAADPATDLALLRVDASGLPALRFGDSDRLRVGDWVCALGHPLRFDHSFTVGVLSSRGRKLFDPSFDAYLQTDAAINPGNSGGPLLDLAGDVVGVTAAVSARGQGVAFAVPSRVAAEVVDRLRRTGEVARGFLGAQLRDVDPDLVPMLGLRDARGALVVEVAPEGPAAAAGLLPYDVVTAVDDEAVAGADAVVAAIAGRAPGTTVRLALARDGQAVKASATLARRDPPLTRPRQAASAGARAPLGLVVEAGTGGGRAGVAIRRVLRPGPGLDQLEVGDVVLELNRSRTPDEQAWGTAVARLAAGQPAFLYVYRPRAGRHTLVKLRASFEPGAGER